MTPIDEYRAFAARLTRIAEEVDCARCMAERLIADQEANLVTLREGLARIEALWRMVGAVHPKCRGLS